MTIRAVLFDLYDTLAEIKMSDYLQAKETIAMRAGVNQNDLIESWKKFTKPSARGEILTVDERIVLTLADLGKEITPEFANELSKIEIELQENQVHKLPGCDFTLKSLKNMGLKVGLVTNTSSVSKNVLGLLEIEQYFDSVIFSYEVGILKPDTAIYKLAASSLNLNESETIFVGDGNDQELDGAKKTGMIAIKVGPGRDEIVKGKQSTEFDYEIQTLPELIPIIDLINS